VCSVQHCNLMYRAITSVFVLERPCIQFNTNLMYAAITSLLVLVRPCVQFSTAIWCTHPSLQYLFWSDRVFSSALCYDAHSHHFIICSGQTLCSVQQCNLMYTAITSVFVLDRPCVQFSTVLWCTQPLLQYIFWSHRVFRSALCSDVHSHHFNLLCTDRVFSLAMCSDVHSHHIISCSGQTVCSVQHCALMYTAITSIFALEIPCV